MTLIEVCSSFINLGRTVYNAELCLDVVRRELHDTSNTSEAWPLLEAMRVSLQNLTVDITDDTEYEVFLINFLDYLDLNEDVIPVVYHGEGKITFDDLELVGIPKGVIDIF